MVSIYDPIVFIGFLTFGAIAIILIAKASKMFFKVDIFAELGIKTDTPWKQIVAMPLGIIGIIGLVLFLGYTLTTTNGTLTKVCNNSTTNSLNQSTCSTIENITKQEDLMFNPNNTAPVWYNQTKQNRFNSVIFNMPETTCAFLSGCTVKPEQVSLDYLCLSNIPLSLTPAIMRSYFVDSYNLNYTSHIAIINCTAYGDNSNAQNYTVTQTIYQ